MARCSSGGSGISLTTPSPARWTSTYYSKLCLTFPLDNRWGFRSGTRQVLAASRVPQSLSSSSRLTSLCTASTCRSVSCTASPTSWGSPSTCWPGPARAPPGPSGTPTNLIRYNKREIDNASCEHYQVLLKFAWACLTLLFYYRAWSTKISSIARLATSSPCTSSTRRTRCSPGSSSSKGARRVVIKSFSIYDVKLMKLLWSFYTQSEQQYLVLLFSICISLLTFYFQTIIRFD